MSKRAQLVKYYGVIDETDRLGSLTRLQIAQDPRSQKWYFKGGI